MRNHLIALTNLYNDYQEQLRIIPAPQDESLKNLVTFDDSKNAPVHRWYTFKEGYSNQLLKTLEERNVINRKSAKRLLDPFCGVATTLLSCQIPEENGYVSAAVGIERNPTIFSIARAKLNWSTYRPEVIKRGIAKLRAPKRGRRLLPPIPKLSTLTKKKNGKRAFQRDVLEDLLFYREWIKQNCDTKPELDFFLLAWTAIIEPASNTRKDGRALRLVSRADEANVKQLLLAQCEMMLQDLLSLNAARPVSSLATILPGDGRYLPFSDNSFTAICYSPPYLNNIDYSEVYKLELWLSEAVSDRDQFRTLRLGTLRSHPSVKFPTTSVCDRLRSQAWIRRLRKALIDALPDDDFRDMRTALFSGYIDDMLITLKEQKRVALAGAPIVCVVGNSLHGGKNNPAVPVCTDLLISSAARAVGLTTDYIQIARQLPRRDHQNGWLRESIIVMRKPHRSS